MTIKKRKGYAIIHEMSKNMYNRFGVTHIHIQFLTIFLDSYTYLPIRLFRALVDSFIKERNMVFN